MEIRSIGNRDGYDIPEFFFETQDGKIAAAV